MPSGCAGLLCVISSCVCLEGGARFGGWQLCECKSETV